MPNFYITAKKNKKSASPCSCFHREETSQSKRRCPWCWILCFCICTDLTMASRPPAGNTCLCRLRPLCMYWLIKKEPAGGRTPAFIRPPPSTSPGTSISNIYKMTAKAGDIQPFYMRGGGRAGGGGTHTDTDRGLLQTVTWTCVCYLYGLPVVDLHHMEVKTVNPFARCNEITPLFVEVFPDIY